MNLPGPSTSADIEQLSQDMYRIGVGYVIRHALRVARYHHAQTMLDQMKSPAEQAEWRRRRRDAYLDMHRIPKRARK